MLWTTLGPLVRQVGRVENPWLPAWHMYRSFGTGLYDVRFTAVGPEGARRIDRLALLGYSDPSAAPLRVRRIDAPAELDRQIARACASLPPGTDLRVSARVGRVRGWETVRTETASACR